MRRGAVCVAALALLGSGADAAPPRMGLYKVDVGGRILAVRAVDADGDGRKDLVVLLLPKDAPGGARTQVAVLKTPAAPVASTFFDLGAAVRIPCDGEKAGARADAGAVALGRFGPKGEARLRFLGPAGIEDVGFDGVPVPAEDRPAAPGTLLRRGGDLVVWDAVADLDGDGRDECWFPDADGRLRVRGGAPASDALVETSAKRSLSTGGGTAFLRKWDVPSLSPADFDGDGRMELAGLEGTTLVAWRREADRMVAAHRIRLPFLEPAEGLAREEVRATRVTIADVDRDGKADLLATMVQGRTDKVGGLRTSLYHYAGPLATPSGALPAPRARIDTESVALHPRFRDLDGDGRLDYVGDSIRGNLFDLIQRIMGKEPEITYAAYRFDPGRGTFEESPYATFVRPYSSSEARSNTFGQAAWFDGDFDRDGHADLLDLGNLTGIEILRGVRGSRVATGGKAAFDEPLLKRVRIAKDSPDLEPAALVVDLNGDRASDAVLWSEGTLYLVVPP